MGTTTEELKKLYAKLGGTDPNIPKASTPGEVLNGINELELGGDKLPEVTDADDGKALGVKQGKWDKMDVDIELPDVTTDDNGKVLMVSEGNWGKSDLPSSGAVIFSMKNANNDNPPAGNMLFENNKNESHVVSALAIDSNYIPTNNEVYIQVKSKNERICALLKYSYFVNNTYYFTSLYRKDDVSATWNSQPIYYYLGINRTGTSPNPAVTISYGLPPLHTGFNGKILKVVNGEWKLGDETVELPSVTASDDGKVLTVVGGAWAKAALSGSWFVATANGCGTGSNNLDKKQQEIFKAVTKNQTQVGPNPDSCNPFVCLNMGVRPTSDDNFQYVVFRNYRATPYSKTIVFYTVATFTSGTYLFETGVSYESTSNTVNYTATKLALASDIPTT